jgi:hypothetical protein
MRRTLKVLVTLVCVGLTMTAAAVVPARAVDTQHRSLLRIGPGEVPATRTVKLGDANLDGNAGLLDLDTLGLNFNVDDNARTWTHADFNGDKDVGLLDLDILGQNFGQSGGSNTPLNIVGIAGGAGSLGGVAVPEPSTIALLMLGFGAVGSLRKRRYLDVNGRSCQSSARAYWRAFSISSVWFSLKSVDLMTQ